jgi:predicted amidophosphoribosyltransferase
MEPSGPIPAIVGLDGCAALLAHVGPGRDLVTALKYRNARSVARWLAAGMARLVDPAGVDLVTWAPTTALRRRSRGFDQAEVLAGAVARQLHLPCSATLARVPGPPQTGRTLVERRDGPQFLGRAMVSGRSVLLVDDVVTTGATLSSAARSLRTAGAAAVVGLAASHPP